METNHPEVLGLHHPGKTLQNLFPERGWKPQESESDDAYLDCPNEKDVFDSIDSTTTPDFGRVFVVCVSAKAAIALKA
jgi:hypothetical protein